MPFESQDSKIKAFSVPLKPAGFSPSAVVYGAGLCFVTCTEGEGSHVHSSLLELHFCFFYSSPFEVRHLAHREMDFFEPSTHFSVWFSCLQWRFAVQGMLFQSLLCLEKGLYKLPNPSLVLLSLPHILCQLHQSGGVSTAGIILDQLAGACPGLPPRQDTIAVSCQPCPSRLIIHPLLIFLKYVGIQGSLNSSCS